MAFRMLSVVTPVGVMSLYTPQGDRHESCVVEIPDSATMVPVDGGIELHHEDGSVESIKTPDHCHSDEVALTLAGAIQPNEWIDEAGFTYNDGFSVMTGYNNIPDAPKSAPGTDYWFLGMQNMQGGPVSILQPVLTYRSSWTAASWACCPSNITTTGNTISAGKEGDRMYGSMIRTSSDTWQILTTVNGQTSTLNAQVGPWAYTWAVATFEDYGVSECSQLPEKPVVFDTIVLKDAKGSDVTPSWKLSGATMCNGRTTSSRPDVVSIQHGDAPSPTPTPTPTPTPSPSPTPGCVDTDSASDCSYWSNQGYCSSSSEYNSYMQQHCCHTCGFGEVQV